MTTYQVASTARRAPGGAAFSAGADGRGSTASPSGVLHAYVRDAVATVCGIPVSALHTFDETTGFPFESQGHGCVTCLDAVA